MRVTTFAIGAVYVAALALLGATPRAMAIVAAAWAVLCVVGAGKWR